MKRYIIIGHSAAGIAAAEAIRSHSDSDEIIIISRENCLPYRKYLLPAYLGGDIKEAEIRYRTDVALRQQKIDLLLQKEVVELRPKKNAVAIQEKDESGDIKRSTLEYDYLIIATGASPRKLELKGMQKHGAYQLSTMDDARHIIDLLPIATTVCIVGGGLIGLSVASVLAKKNSELKLIVETGHVFSKIIDKEAAQIIQQQLQEKGIDFLLQSRLTEIIGEGDVKAVRINNQKIVGCSVVIIGKGTCPNSGICEGTEIEKGEGVIVDDHMRTNIPNIFAAGSVCERYNTALRQKVKTWSWEQAVEQGRIAGLNSCGKECVYTDTIHPYSFVFFDIPVSYAGVFSASSDTGSKEHIVSDGKKYTKVITCENHVVGFIAVGTTEHTQMLYGLLQTHSVIPGSIEQLLQQPSMTDVADVHH